VSRIGIPAPAVEELPPEAKAGPVLEEDTSQIRLSLINGWSSARRTYWILWKELRNLGRGSMQSGKAALLDRPTEDRIDLPELLGGIRTGSHGFDQQGIRYNGGT